MIVFAFRTVRWAGYVAAALVAGWWFDLPGRVARDPRVEALLERRAQLISAAFWTAVPLLLAYAGVTVMALPASAWGCVVLARRLLAMRGASWPARRLVADTKFWIRHQPWVPGLALLGVVGAVVYAQATSGDPVRVGSVVLILAAYSLTAWIAGSEAAWRKRVTQLTPSLAAACRVLPKVIDDAMLRPIRGGGLRILRVPPQVVGNAEGLEAGVAEQMPQYEAWVHHDPATSAVTSINLTPASDEAQERRQIARETGGLVVDLVPVPGRHHPGTVRVLLGTEVGPTRGGQVDVALQERGLRVVAWHPNARQATAARIGPRTAELRDGLIRELGLKGEEPWSIDIVVRSFGEDKMPAHISVVSSPGMGSAEKRQVEWDRAIRSLLPPEMGERWRVDDDPVARTVELVREADPLREVQVYDWAAPVDLHHVPFGMREDGTPLSLPLLEMNTLVGGIPGGGKSGGLTALLCGISRLPHVALVGLDPKRVEQAPWKSRFTRIAKDEASATDVLERLRDEMGRRYEWLEAKGLKKFGPSQFSDTHPLIAVMVDELADLVSVGSTKEDKALEAERSTLIRRLVAKGRAAGFVVISATQKPQSDVVPTALRDLKQLRVAYATTTPDMTDTILGKSMAQNGGEAHTISADQRGVCYIVSETSRTPGRARTYWVPDEEVEAIAQRTAHLRVELPWLTNGLVPVAVGGRAAADEIIDLGVMELELPDEDPFA